MKEDMLEVLIYLFENYMIDGIAVEPEHQQITEELVGAGFANEEINKAFVWLEDLLDLCEQTGSIELVQQSTASIRFYTQKERQQFKLDGLALINRLVNVGVLDSFLREMVIDRVMALDSMQVNIDHIRWVILMVLSNRPGFDDIAEWAEVIVTEEVVPVIH